MLKDHLPDIAASFQRTVVDALVGAVEHQRFLHGFEFVSAEEFEGFEVIETWMKVGR